MIAHPIYSSTARLATVLAIGLASVVLFASSAAKPANADASQWVISQPHSSWNGWHIQNWNRGNMQGGSMQGGSMQGRNMPRWNMQQWGQHDGGDFHSNSDDFHHDHHDNHFDGHGFVIINTSPFFFNQGFVTPAFLGFPPPFIITQPGFIVGQPFVPGQPHFFVDPHFVHQQAAFVARHPSLGQTFPSHRTHSMMHSSSGMVIRSGTH